MGSSARGGQIQFSTHVSLYLRNGARKRHLEYELVCAVSISIAGKNQGEDLNKGKMLLKYNKTVIFR